MLLRPDGSSNDWTDGADMAGQALLPLLPPKFPDSFHFRCDDRHCRHFRFHLGPWTRLLRRHCRPAPPRPMCGKYYYGQLLRLSGVDLLLLS